MQHELRFSKESLRDWFAGQALAGMMADIITLDAPERAKYAYYQADEMLKAREVKSE